MSAIFVAGFDMKPNFFGKMVAFLFIILSMALIGFIVHTEYAGVQKFEELPLTNLAVKTALIIFAITFHVQMLFLPIARAIRITEDSPALVSALLLACNAIITIFAIFYEEHLLALYFSVACMLGGCLFADLDDPLGYIAQPFCKGTQGGHSKIRPRRLGA